MGFLSGDAQNLIPNPDLEFYSECPSGLRQIDKVAEWFSASPGTPEYFNSCDFKANTTCHSGDGMLGLITYASYESDLEYVGVRLLDSLRAGVNYCFSFYLQADAENPVLQDKIGAYFSQELVQMAYWKLGSYRPQIRLNEIALPGRWTKVEGKYRALGGEQYLYLGNFYTKDKIQTIQNVKPESQGWYSYCYFDSFKLFAGGLDCRGGEKSQMEKPASGFQKKLVLYFDSDDFALPLVQEMKLIAFLNQLPKTAKMQVHVSGHTDSDASQAYNMKLALRRANTVEKYLEAENNFSIIKHWLGEKELVNAEKTESDKALNRRVEITVNP